MCRKYTANGSTCCCPAAFGWGRAAILLAMSCMIAVPRLRAQPGRAPGRPVAERIAAQSVVRSSSRRFVVVGPDAQDNLDLAVWVERIAGDMERAVGMKQGPSPHRVLRIIAREPDAARKSSVSVSCRLVGNRYDLHLVVDDPRHAELGEILEGFCRLFMTGYVIDLVFARRDGAESRAGGPNGRRDAGTRGPLPAPNWLSRGFAQNRTASLRASNAETVFRQWQAGAVPSLLQFLQGQEEPNDEERSLHRAMCGLLFRWLQLQRERENVFSGMFGLLADGRPVLASDLCRLLPDCGTAMNLEERWDEWIYRQRRIVHDPGKPSQLAVDQLRAQVLLYPGDSGIPLTANLDRPIRFVDLVGIRDAEWVPTAAASKIASLRIIAVGRSRAFARVVELYCRFLSELQGRRRPKQLRELLRAAEEALCGMDETAAPSRNRSGPGPGDGTGDPREQDETTQDTGGLD